MDGKNQIWESVVPGHSNGYGRESLGWTKPLPSISSILFAMASLRCASLCAFVWDAPGPIGVTPFALALGDNVGEVVMGISNSGLGFAGIGCSESNGSVAFSPIARVPGGRRCRSGQEGLLARAVSRTVRSREGLHFRKTDTSRLIVSFPCFGFWPFGL
jgi:hypothetical protein